MKIIALGVDFLIDDNAADKVHPNDERIKDL